MDKYINPVNTNFYGDNVRWFVGTVVDNNDIETTVTLGRVKIRAFGVHENVSEEMLPWASVVLPTTEGGNGTGAGSAIDIGAQVFGFFLDGANSQYPLVLGTIPFKRTEFTDINSAVMGGSEFAGQALPTDASGGDLPSTGPIDPDQAGVLTYRYFRSVGYNDAQARGIYGNLAHESGNFRADVVDLSQGTDLDGNSYGIAQWRGSRLQQLRTFASQRNLSPGDLTTQLQFVEYELQHNAYHGREGLLRCSTPAQAAVHFMRTYERPAVLPGGGNSSYRDPVWDPNGSVVPMRYGETQRIELAVNTRFSAAQPSVSEQGVQ